MKKIDRERAAIARVVAAQTRSMAAFELLRRGNLSPDEEAEVKAAEAEAKAARRSLRLAITSIKDAGRSHTL